MLSKYLTAVRFANMSLWVRTRQTMRRWFLLVTALGMIAVVFLGMEAEGGADKKNTAGF
jgi:hypothetical protein